MKSEQQQPDQIDGVEQPLPPQLIELVRLLARQAARQAIEESRSNPLKNGK